MLGLGKKDSSAAADAADQNSTSQGSAVGSGPGGSKGHATPSRREAEDARKNQLKIPKDPKAAKKASRQRDQEDRARARQGMKNGEERYLPARDRGPARAFVRDFVDGRITLAEFFIFIAIAVLALGFIRNSLIQSWVSIGFFALTALIVVDTVVLLVQLSLKAKKAFPEAKDRKGLLLYATLRTLQLRRLRLPPPRVRRGGAPKI
ncbi:MAG: DUF3043 domain-containing protein [Candidatus Nanopelagicales bacterium]|nr:DUF3043 domain-containing protein [Candidatus Nanopelagicales bacterium]